MKNQKRVFSEEHKKKLSVAKKGNRNAKKEETVIEFSISFYSPHLEIAYKMIRNGEGDNLSQVVRKALEEWAEARL